VSKRIYMTAKWKSYSRRRQLDELEKTQRRKKLRSPDIIGLHEAQSERRLRKKRMRAFHTIVAPEVFSIAEDPEGVIQFLHEIAIMSRTHNISLDLRRIETLGPDAVAALLATIRREEIHSTTQVRGNHPIAEKPREILIDSGFFVHVHSTVPVKRPTKGLISEKKSKKVEPRTARDLIHVATTALYGDSRRCQPAYRVLIECMNNTHDHASRHDELRETWWATAYADLGRGRTCYTFLDTGVGIFGSVKVGRVRRLFHLVGIADDARILRDILLGRVESSTGKPYRGKGLPAIYQHSQRGAIKSLVIVANNVYANVSRDDFRQMRIGFRGTLLYWEV
jgi:hypothetical protein